MGYGLQSIGIVNTSRKIMRYNIDTDPQRILIVRLSAMGDVLLSTPLVRILKKRFPDSEIDFIIKKEYASLIRNNPHISHIIEFSSKDGLSELLRISREIKRREYDVIVDIQLNLRSRILKFLKTGTKKFNYNPNRFQRFVLVHLRKDIYKDIQPVPLRYIRSVSDLEVEDDGLGLELYIDKVADRTVDSIFKKSGLQNGCMVISMAPGAGRATKRWTEDGYIEVGRYFINKGYRVVLLGGEGDVGVCSRIFDKMGQSTLNLTGKLSLQQTAAAIKKSDLLITNDTGLMHMAAALNTRVVAIFGPTSYHFGFLPFRCESFVVEKSLKCRPCSFHGTDRCPKGHFYCMKSIKSSEVVEAAEILLDKDKR